MGVLITVLFFSALAHELFFQTNIQTGKLCAEFFPVRMFYWLKIHRVTVRSFRNTGKHNAP